MAHSILIACVESSRPAPARVPKALSRAGFDVSLLAPKGALAEKSRYCKRIGHLPEGANVAQWVHAFAAMIRATRPALVLPGDDTTFRLMDLVVHTQAEALRGDLHRELATVIRTSLGDPAWYRPSVDNTLLPDAAESIGIRVPRSVVVGSMEAAIEFAATNGYPIVLKRPFASAGIGVEACRDQAALERAHAMLVQMPRGPLDSADARILAQAFVRGPTRNFAAAAWQGDLLTGYAGEEVVDNREVARPSTVVRFVRDDALSALAARLARGFGISGLFSAGFVKDDRTGEWHLLEIDRWLTPSIVRGSAIGVDHCVALASALSGAPLSTRPTLDEGEEQLTVHFPQEWLRNPESTWLRTHPVDVPWDEPELFEAMLDVRP